MKWILLVLSLTLAEGASAKPPLDIMPVRGFCIAAPRPDGLDDFIRFVDNELAPRHVNTLVLRVDYNYQYKTHPELRDKDALSEGGVKKLVAVCRKDGIRIIPEIDLLGHQSIRTHVGNLLRVYPEFDETPWIKIPSKYDAAHRADFYCKSYCPLQPKVHEVVFALMDELCDVFEADAFHAGMDEVFFIGESKCPRCAGHDPSELFAGEVRLLHDHLRQRGRSLWIWGDRLLDGTKTGVGKWESSYANTYRAIDMIPKDVTICDWHYEKPVPTAAYFALKGFNVITCPWKIASCAEIQADDMAHWRETSPAPLRDHFQGMMQTVWSSPKVFFEKDYAGKAPPTNGWSCFVGLYSEIGKLEKEATHSSRP